MSLQFTRLNERFAALSAHMNPGTVSVEVLPHGGVVAEHLGAAFVRTGDGS